MSPSSSVDICIICDGGAKGNPGKGYGSYRLETNGVKQPVRRLTFGDEVTNNQAEYWTLIAALNDVSRLLEKFDYSPQYARIQLLTDSNLVVNQVAGKWKVKHHDLRPLVTEAQNALNQFGSWSIDWHSRSNSVKVLGH